MKSMKWWMGLWTVAAIMLLAVPGARGEATVTDVTARQRYPWNGLVDIACKVTGIEGETMGLKFAVATLDGTSGTEQPVSHVQVVKNGAESDDLTVSANGSYSLVWDARADLGEGQWGDMVVRVTIAAQGTASGGVQLWEGGPYWAEKNIGAENPWDYGYYFWWGDTVGYKRVGDAWVASDGSPQNLQFYYNDSISGRTLNDYETLQNEGWITAAGVLVPQHDAAYVQWGEVWRLPTDQELRDLLDKCIGTKETVNGINGYLFRGRGAYASNSIFLPAAGRGRETYLYSDGSQGYYWSSIPLSHCYHSWFLEFSPGYSHSVNYSYYPRHDGLSVRPVRGPAN